MKRFIFFIILITCCSFVNSEIVDKMAAEWEICTDSGAVINRTISESSNKIDYDLSLSSGDWVEIYKDDFDKLDISKGDAISFSFKGSGASNNLNLQIYEYDSNGDVFGRKISKVTGITEWRDIIVPFISMSSWTIKNKDGSIKGDSILDTDKITKIAFSVTPDTTSSITSGSIAIDNIQTYKLNTEQMLLVSSFDFGTPPNDVGGTEGSMAPSDPFLPTVEYDKENAYEGIYSLKLTYNYIVSTWCGYYIFITTAGDNGYRDLSEYTDLEFYVKSDVAGKKFKIQLKDASTTTVREVELVDHLDDGTSTSWDKVSIPISSFTPVVVTTAVKQVNFVFDYTHGSPYAGEVYIDSLKFTKSGTYTGGTISDVDDMDADYGVSGWENAGKDEDKGITTTNLANIKGTKEQAIQLNYSFNRSPVHIADWVVIERDWGLNLAKVNTVKFQYKGIGAKNNIEIKIGDKNETRFWRKYFGITDTSGLWKDIAIPMKEFIFFTPGEGNEEEIDLERIKSVHFTISKNKGGQGIVYVKNFETILKSSYEVNRPGKLIKNLNVINNPFSPNSDGIEDKVKFVYMLSQTAKVKLKIFDLAGEVVYKEDAGEKEENVEHVIEWEGRSNSNSTVKNGLYFYQIFAKTDNKNDKINHVVAVFR